jgi:hypothetical protein
LSPRPRSDVDRYLEKFDPPLYYDLPELQSIAGRVIEETVVVGNTNRWQALNRTWHITQNNGRLRSSRNSKGMPATLPVMQGDLVTR